MSGYSLNFDRDIGLETRQEETGLADTVVDFYAAVGSTTIAFV